MNTTDLKHRKTLPILATFLCFGLYLLASDAFGLRCGNRIVSTDDSKLYVLKACGAPDIIDPEPFSFFNNEIWEYDRGPNQFMYSIKFSNGRVTHIKRGNYGFAQ